MIRRALVWWPVKVCADPALTTTPYLAVRLPRRLELFLWWQRRPRALLAARG